MSLKGRVAAVTGATGGIGFEVAAELASRGATVVACSRRLSDAQDVAKKIGGGARGAELDIASAASVRAFAKSLVASEHGGVGRIDILVNNAGYPFQRDIWYKRFHEVTDAELESVMRVDLAGTFRLTRAIIPLMLDSRNGKEKKGRERMGGVIISISSTPALVGHTEGAPYSLAKAGIIAMTKHIALEYGRDNIRAYTLALGNIATDATFKSMTEKERQAAAGENAMRRWGRPSEVARVVASLASDDFSFSTGNTIVVDGGAVLL